ncbi:MAG: EamA family transporter RarD [Dermatophilaceae bacterium]
MSAEPIATRTTAGNRRRSRPSSHGTGVLYGLGAYGLWGGFPLYFTLLAPAGPWEIVAHRIAWSMVFCTVLLVASGGLTRLWERLRDRRTLIAVALGGLFVSVNWTLYLIAVTSDQIADAALGYFMNPLVSVALGLVVLRERLRPLQGFAVGIAALGAVYLSVQAHSVPVLPLGLAFSFGLYGLVKNRVGAHLTALESLTAETVCIAPVAAVMLFWVAVQGQTTFGVLSAGHTALLISTGVVTAVPLLMFAAAARRVTLVTIGLMQFLAPILQFATALLLGEQLSQARWIGFGIIWAAVGVLVVDMMRASWHRSIALTRPSPRSDTNV